METMREASHMVVSSLSKTNKWSKKKTHTHIL